MTDTTRIRWELTQYGGWTGHVGTMKPWAFQIWQVDGPDSPWRLDPALLGQFGYHVDHPDPEALKSHAERWLEEFVSSLGAVFPEAVLKLADEWKQFAVSGDAQDECADMLREAITAALAAAQVTEEKL
jgi:hypothetical protein